MTKHKKPRTNWHPQTHLSIKSWVIVKQRVTHSKGMKAQPRPILHLEKVQERSNCIHRFKYCEITLHLILYIQHFSISLNSNVQERVCYPGPSLFDCSSSLLCRVSLNLPLTQHKHIHLIYTQSYINNLLHLAYLVRNNTKWERNIILFHLWITN